MTQLVRLQDGMRDGGSTLAELEQLPIPASGRAVYLSEGGRSGNFVFDSSDLSSEVGADTQQGIYIAPSSDATGASGAWVRQYEGAVNVKWFGAVGDGVTDDAAAILAGITAADADADFAYVPSGSYLCSASVVCTTDVRLLGEGVLDMGGSLTVPDAAGVEVHVEGLTFNFSGNAGIFQADTGGVMSKATFQDIRVNGGSGVRLIGGCSDALMIGCEFNNLSVTSGKVAAFQIGNNQYADAESTRFVRVIGNNVDGVSNSTSGETHAFLIYGKDIAISNNTVSDVYHAAETACEAIYTKGVRVAITGNTILDCGPTNDGCITVKGQDRGAAGSPEGHECIISGNVISYEKNNTTPRVWGIASPVQNVTISGNQLYNCGLYFNGPENLLVQGNSIVIDVDGIAFNAIQQENGGDAVYIGNYIRQTVRGLDASTVEVVRIRGQAGGTTAAFINNDIRGDWTDLTSGTNAIACVSGWADSAEVALSLTGNLFRINAANIGSTPRFSSVVISGSNDVNLKSYNNSDNWRHLNNNNSGTLTLDAEGNVSPAAAITTDNVGVGQNDWFFCADNIGATANRNVSLNGFAQPGRTVEVTASNRTRSVTLVCGGSDTYEDGSTTSRTLSASGRVVLKCFEPNVWTPILVQGTFA